jgi:pimeloyl-ACP methyl ester carboxylesterase
VEPPETRYAWNGEDALAYQVFGQSATDLVYLQGYASNVVLQWEHPGFVRFAEALARFVRVIVTDRRGLGCSERFTPRDIPPIETLVDDLRAVLDAAGSDRPVIFASGDCGFIAIVFAAMYPERVSALVLYDAAASWQKSVEVPWGRTLDEIEESTRRSCSLDGSWSKRANPSLTAGEDALAWFVRYERLSIAQGGCRADGWRFARLDVRGTLSSIQVPTLLLYNEDAIEEQASGHLHSGIRGSRLVAVPGTDYFPWADHQDAVIRQIESFLTDVQGEEADLERMLATVLFTDIVGSTTKVGELGDERWRDLLERHHATMRALLARYRGKELDTAGDGFFASFDGPARAVRCAQAAIDALRPLDLEIRAGVHTGEVETVEDK